MNNSDVFCECVSKFEQEVLIDQNRAVITHVDYPYLGFAYKTMTAKGVVSKVWKNLSYNFQHCPFCGKRLTERCENDDE